MFYYFHKYSYIVIPNLSVNIYLAIKCDFNTNTISFYGLNKAMLNESSF